jgi:outer membrane lipoprotein carrier protein
MSSRGIWSVVSNTVYTLFVLSIVYGSAAAFAQQNVVQNVQRTYQRIDDAVIRYEQVVLFPVTRTEQTFRGVVYMKKPDYYRIESEQQTVVTDGETIWSYNPFTDQIIIDRFRPDEQMFTPDRFLLNVPDDFYTTVGERETVEGRTLILVRLVPKSDHQFVRSMRLWIDESEWIVRRAEVIDLNENRTTYIVTDIQLNPGLDRDLFEYRPPEDAEIIDLR